MIYFCLEDSKKVCDSFLLCFNDRISFLTFELVENRNRRGTKILPSVCCNRNAFLISKTTNFSHHTPYTPELLPPLAAIGIENTKFDWQLTIHWQSTDICSVRCRSDTSVALRVETAFCGNWWLSNSRWQCNQHSAVNSQQPTANNANQQANNSKSATTKACNNHNNNSSNNNNSSSTWLVLIYAQLARSRSLLLSCCACKLPLIADHRSLIESIALAFTYWCRGANLFA